MRSDTKRKGFTLIELLIVIVVIGILSAMMMLSSTEAVTSAKASNIVSNLRNLKTAAVAYYTDHIDACNDTNFDINTKSSDVLQYLSKGAANVEIPDMKYYSFITADTNDADAIWYVVCDVTQVSNAAAEQNKIKEKLAGRAKSLGLVGFTTNTKSSKPDGAYGIKDGETQKGSEIDKYVGLVAR